ncbi:hypothetical protein [Risungbinella massiliensis]|uniref:hypothetical protein n=1 Tax=Risungbinella massiliensis TaxID=1329796 RepID=UPI0005CC7BAB|nr:hypothetical protein [Risungbinella massiliensis]
MSWKSVGLFCIRFPIEMFGFVLGAILVSSWFHAPFPVYMEGDHIFSPFLHSGLFQTFLVWKSIDTLSKCRGDLSPEFEPLSWRKFGKTLGFATFLWIFGFFFVTHIAWESSAKVRTRSLYEDIYRYIVDTSLQEAFLTSLFMILVTVSLRTFYFWLVQNVEAFRPSTNHYYIGPFQFKSDYILKSKRDRRIKSYTKPIYSKKRKKQHSS